MFILHCHLKTNRYICQRRPFVTFNGKSDAIERDGVTAHRREVKMLPIVNRRSILN